MLKKFTIGQQPGFSFIEDIRSGGGAPRESGPAIMCDYTIVERDQFRKIITVTAYGALYDNVSGLKDR